MRILFISRAYPPVTGGIENQNAALALWLAKETELTLLANKHGKKALPFFLPYALFRSLVSMRHYDVLLLGDGVLGIIGFFVKLLYPRKTVVSVVHGLDLTYTHPLYRALWVKCFLPSLDSLIAVSQETRERALEKNIPPEKVLVIQNGIETEAFQGAPDREALASLLHENLDDKWVLLTTGRLAKRKGAAWFISHVMPRLSPRVLYVLAGAGPEEAAIRQAAAATHMGTRVKMLGRVSDSTRNLLLQTADLFVQPNIHVPGDMEGFGIAVIEAASAKRPIVAANIEGLKDAVTHEESGLLVESENTEAFVKSITELLDHPEAREALGERAAQFVATHNHWRIISKRYREALEACLKRVQS